MYNAAARTALAIALLAAAAVPAQAAYTWSGKTLSEMYGDKMKISTKCGKETKRQVDVDNFLTRVDGARSRLGEFVKSLAEDTKAVQDAKATKDMKKEADAMVSEMKKMKLTVRCSSGSGTLDMKVKAQNSKGTEITLIQP
jgi:hypothetical protein